MFYILKSREHFHQRTIPAPRWIGSSTLQTIFLISISSTALAIEPIPEDTGISGFINPGIFGATVKSNMLAEMPLVDIGAETITSLTDEPGSEGFLLPSVSYELAYTWAQSRTQLYIGNQLEDFLRFDLTTNVGVRKEFGRAGIFAVEAISSSFTTRVWSDPYATNVKRDSTSKTVSGARIIWDQILGSAAEIRVSSVTQEVDNETSGTALGLTVAERDSLNREGDVNRIDIQYAFPVGNGLFVPRLKFTDYDLDGEAMAHDGTVLELSYATKIGALSSVTNLNFGKKEYDVINPVPAFGGIKDEADLLGFNTTILWGNIFGLKDWMGNASFIFVTQDHDIDFYDTQITAIRFGALHKF